jgi:hypothetical protein
LFNILVSFSDSLLFHQCGILNESYLPCLFIIANMEFHSKSLSQSLISEKSDEKTAIDNFLGNNPISSINGKRITAKGLSREESERGDGRKQKRNDFARQTDGSDDSDWLFNELDPLNKSRSFSQKAAIPSNSSSQSDFNFAINYEASSATATRTTTMSAGTPRVTDSPTTAELRTSSSATKPTKPMNKRKFSTITSTTNYSLDWD